MGSSRIGLLFFFFFISLSLKCLTKCPEMVSVHSQGGLSVRNFQDTVLPLSSRNLQGSHSHTYRSLEPSSPDHPGFSWVSSDLWVVQTWGRGHTHKGRLILLSASHRDRNEIQQALPEATQSVLSSVGVIKGSRMCHQSCPRG